MVLEANREFLRTVSLRITGLYGEGKDSITEIQLQRLRRGEHKFQIEDNSALWAFVYIEDAARAHVLASKALLHGGQAQTDPKVDGEAFFITDGTAEPFWDICRSIWKEAGDDTPLEKVTIITLLPMLIFAAIGEWLFWAFTFGKREPELRRHDLEYLRTGCFVSIQKARERLGFEPLVDRPEGIRRGVKWALGQESKAKKDT
ncbi:hypothetical protein OCU04_013032 [Sclerotinia nivalis]|uniref:3-beta hydroxysteroid dehydrogenase/isomerase domain-containing protein n=1 Tax=Sclerotinia nivalis TaxID=352851 RepID=A0A9X0A7X6_9HELO|nr:hypothetical protein OCU04_013032 [Sclerotinia nivalis]